MHPGKPVIVDRYTVGARINHWITAISLVLLALSGLALFTPSLYFLTGLFGGGQWTRIIHPWIGVVLFVSFLGLFFRFFRLNLWQKTDSVWMSRIRDVLAGDENKLPDVGKYNAGQKTVFWSMSLLILILIVTGVVSWDEISAATSPSSRSASRCWVHAAAAVVAICVLDRSRLCRHLGPRHHRLP